MDNVTDPDSGALLGIAVTAADTANGSWYYSTNGGTNWNALGAVATNNARLLAADANTRLYFQPNANYNGTLASAITFRAWDQTSGSNGALADTTTNGGTTAFSTATDTASLVINPVNDARRWQVRTPSAPSAKTTSTISEPMSRTWWPVASAIPMRALARHRGHGRGYQQRRLAVHLGRLELAVDGHARAHRGRAACQRMRQPACVSSPMPIGTASSR